MLKLTWWLKNNQICVYSVIEKTDFYNLTKVKIFKQPLCNGVIKQYKIRKKYKNLAITDL